VKFFGKNNCGLGVVGLGNCFEKKCQAHQGIENYRLEHCGYVVSLDFAFFEEFLCYFSDFRLFGQQFFVGTVNPAARRGEILIRVLQVGRVGVSPLSNEVGF
jgi:hypothetical protein